KFIRLNSLPRIHSDPADPDTPGPSVRSEEPMHSAAIGLHRSFAADCSVQDDSLGPRESAQSVAKAYSPSDGSGPHNHKTRAPTSARTTPPSPSASAAEARQTAAP